MKKIIVTGATGFIGKSLIHKIHKDFDLIILSRNPNRAREKLSNLVRENTLYYQYSFNLPDLKNVSGVIHLAANTEKLSCQKSIYETNLLIPFKLYKEIKKNHGFFINLSTTYYESESNNYLVSKKTFSDLLKIEGGDYLNLNLDIVFGVDSPKERFVQYCLRQILDPKVSHFALTKGLQYRNFIHVDDVASILSLILKNKRLITPIKEVDIGNKYPLRIKEVVYEIHKQFDRKGTVLDFGAINYGSNYQQDINSKIKPTEILTHIGWQPKENTIEEIILTCKDINNRNTYE